MFIFQFAFKNTETVERKLEQALEVARSNTDIEAATRGMSHDDALRTVMSVPEYREEFKRVFLSEKIGGSEDQWNRFVQQYQQRQSQEQAAARSHVLASIPVKTSREQTREMMEEEKARRRNEFYPPVA